MITHAATNVVPYPRHGRLLLCEALGNAGVAGRPAEYFWRDDEHVADGVVGQIRPLVRPVLAEVEPGEALLRA